MPRPHEDIEHHTPVDHRAGGPSIALPVRSWCAIEIVRLTAERVGAGVSTYETLIEHARTSSAKAGAAAVFRSINNRRVIALVQLDGHAGFRHLKAAWDDHHLNAERHAIAESHALTLFEVVAGAGDVHVDPASQDAYAFEQVAREPQHVSELLAPIVSAQGFVGAVVFGTDDANSSAILYRFGHAAEIDSFRVRPATLAVLGPLGASGETIAHVHPVKTFA